MPPTQQSISKPNSDSAEMTAFDIETFTSQMLNGPPNIELWDMLPEVAFWIKDRYGRFVWVNTTLANQTRMPREQVIGKRDVDCFPSELAHIYAMDDHRIVCGEPPIVNKSELVMTPEGGVEWRKTSKLPVLDKNKRIIGTTGVSRKVDSANPLPAEYAAIMDILDFVRENLSGGLTIQSIAEHFHLSLSTLERYFRSHLRTTPHDFLLKIKMQKARQLLTSSLLNISEISYECGYESVSSFSRAFRKFAGMTAVQYREHQRSGD